jgi:hypothetical protein
LTSEDIVEPLVQVKQSKKRAYRRPSRREIVRRCIQLSREIRSQCDSAGTGEVSLYDTKFLEGRNRGVDLTASSAETTDCASLLEFATRKGCTIPRTSLGDP